MENKNTEIVKKEESISLGRQSFIERMIEKSASFEDVKKVGEAIIKSGFCPAHFKEKNDAIGVIMCIEAGQQLGLSWMQSLSNLYPVKGMVGIMGDAAKALIISKPYCEYWIEETKGTYPNDDYTHIIRSKRKGLENEYYSEFSVWEAKQAGLFAKEMYKKWGKRMVAYRNIGFHTRDKWADVMKGFKTKEELDDYDETITITTSDGKIIHTTETRQNDLRQTSQDKNSSIIEDLENKNQLVNSQKENKSEINSDINKEENQQSKRRGRPKKEEMIQNKPIDEKNSKMEIDTNKDKKDEPDSSKVNMSNEFTITPLKENGEREFGEVNDLYFKLVEDMKISEEVFANIKIEILEFDQFDTLEDLCFKGTEDQILKLIDKANKLK